MKNKSRSKDTSILKKYFVYEYDGKYHAIDNETTNMERLHRVRETYPGIFIEAQDSTTAKRHAFMWLK